MLSREENERLTRVGPGTPMGELFRRFWLPAMLSTELPEPDCPPVRLRLLGEDLVAFRDTSGRAGVLAAHCPHRGASLFFGRNEECGLRCVYHGWKFDVEGRCVDMPNEPPESNFKDKVRQRAYPAREAGKVVWVYMGPSDLLPELPQLEWTLVPDDHVYAHKRIQDCSWLQNLEGELDSSHISFLHRDTRLSALPLFVFNEGAPRFTVLPTDYGLLVGAQRRESETTDYWRLTQFLLPSYTMIPAVPEKFIDFTAAIPIDDEHMIGLTVAWRPDRPLSEADVARIETWDYVYSEVDPKTFRPVRNRENDYLIDRSIQKTVSFTGIKGVRDQDHAVQEGMGAIVDRTTEHLGSADAAVIQARRLLLRLLDELEQGQEPYAASHGATYRVRSAVFNLERSASFEEAAQRLMQPVA
jgi:phthalate 4,5-dioxygenase oxygenase subunit